MSRCFPFPPPGYEKKPRSEHVDLLAKEKHKEKKHKKEKDKGKREGKERRDKDKSKDKHREKKDRKEKHKEKKRDKEKDKEKKTSDDRKIERQEGRSEDKLADCSRKDEEFKNSKFAEELGRRIKDEGAANRMFENNVSSIQGGVDGLGTGIAMDRDRGDGNKRVTSLVGKEEKRNAGMGGPVEKAADKKIEGLLDRAKDTHEMVARLIGKEQRGEDAFGQAVDQNANKKVEGKEKSRDSFEMVTDLINKEQRRNDRMHQYVEKYVDKKIEGKEKAKDMHDAVTNLINKEQRRDDEMGRPLEKDANKNSGGKEKAKANDGKGDRHKERDREKKHKRKDKDRHKGKEKEKEKIKEKSEHRSKEPVMTNESEKKDPLCNLIIKPIVSHEDSGKCPSTDGNTKKRKDFQINGFSHENDGRPNKLPKPMPSSHVHVENGRTLESCHVANAHSSVKHGATNNMDLEKVLDKKDKINGVAGAPSSVDLRSSVGATTSQKSEGPIKPPHPDSKYLGLIYSVPKLEAWPELDDQEWLFSSKALQPKPRTDFEPEETPQVWAEALQIKSADVLALPYVIPY